MALQPPPPRSTLQTAPFLEGPRATLDTPQTVPPLRVRQIEQPNGKTVFLPLNATGDQTFASLLTGGLIKIPQRPLLNRSTLPLTILIDGSDQPVTIEINRERLHLVEIEVATRSDGSRSASSLDVLDPSKRRYLAHRVTHLIATCLGINEDQDMDNGERIVPMCYPVPL